MGAMRMKKIVIVAGIVLIGAMAFLHGRAAGEATPSAQRHFEFTYDVHVPAPAAGAGGLRVWIPVPVSNVYQEISDLKIESPVAFKRTRDAEYGDNYAFFEEKAGGAFDVKMRFEVLRREHRVIFTTLGEHAVKPDPLLVRFLQPDRLVPIDGQIEELSREYTQTGDGDLEHARRTYEYVVKTMRYDKSGEGWGHGDAVWACNSKRGNCTDFHSLFIGMLRAAGIPAKFEIGFPLPADKSSGDIAGYHCWAEFFVDGLGWVPVDASEAWKHPELHDYFFGAHDANRVQFTTGRDIRLSPAQKAGLLNYSVYPYAEQGGKVFEGVTTHFAFRDLPAGETKTTAEGAKNGADAGAR
jgi:transglutaminase-like putative cysteine protease